MHKFRFGQKQTKNLIVSMAMAAVIAIPMFAQPLGLALTFTAPVADTNEAQQTALQDQDTLASLQPAEGFDSLDVELNRSLAEADVETFLLAGSGEIDGDDENLPADPDEFEALADAGAEEPDDEPAEEPADPVVDIDDHTVYVTRNGVNLRAEPSTESAALAQLSQNTKLTATGELPGWKRVLDASGREGYIAEEFVSQTVVFTDKNDVVYVTRNGVNLRAEPTTSSARLAQLSQNTKLTRTGIGDGWTRVKTAAGKVGYVASTYLTTTAPPKPKTTTAAGGATGGSAPANSSGNKIVDAAVSMLGVRYVFGSESRSGVDCSGLVYYCYRQVGISVPRSSSSYASFGTAVSYANIQPGDVIAFDTRKNDGRTSITHVAIYIGGGTMIHASSSLGKVVKANVAQYQSYGMKLLTIRRIRG